MHSLEMTRWGTSNHCLHCHGGGTLDTDRTCFPLSASSSGAEIGEERDENRVRGVGAVSGCGEV